MADFDPETGEIQVIVPEDDNNRLPAMPGDVAKAIVAVKASVIQLGYDEKNVHANYPYVSVDKFYHQIGRKMAEAGLLTVMDEVHTEIRVRESSGKSGTSAWLHAQYAIYLVHASGATWGPLRRKIVVVASGPQAYGSAQSYLEKQFLRALFKIPTGERDEVDSMRQDGLDNGQAQQQPKPTVTRPQSQAVSPAKNTPAPAPAALTVSRDAAGAPQPDSENPAPVEFQEAPGRVQTPPPAPAPAAVPAKGAPVAKNSPEYQKGVADFMTIKQKLAAAATYAAFAAALDEHKARLDEIAELGPEPKQSVERLLDRMDVRSKTLPQG